MSGFQSKRAMTLPDIPRIKKWHDVLRYEWGVNFAPIEETSNDAKLKRVTEMMQKKFPGPYVIEVRYNKKRMVFAPELVFNSEQEELLWKMKYA